MTWLHLSLLGGGALMTALPIVLHLVMRRQPRRVEFPAVRLVKVRRQQNQRRLQLRHLALLALRCLALAALGAALARPTVAAAAAADWGLVGMLAFTALLCGGLALAARLQSAPRALAWGLAGLAGVLLVASAGYGAWLWRGGPPAPLPDQEAPVAAALVFDTSPRMQYRQQNQTRLAASQEIGSWLLTQFPAESQAAVIDSHPRRTGFLADLPAAGRAIDRLTTTTVHQSLIDSLRQAVELLQRSDQERREIYVITDAAAAAWDSPAAERLRESLAQRADIPLYVIDVGAATPRNVVLGDVQLSAQQLAPGGQLTVSLSVAAVGEPATATVELAVEQLDPTLPIVRDGRVVTPPLVVRDRRTVELSPGEPQQLAFEISGLEVGVRHGVVRLVGDDALSIDNQRSFTVEVRPAWPVLIAAPPTAAPSLVVEALAPYEFRQLGQARFDCKVIRLDELGSQPLGSFAAVLVLDPQPLPASVWSRLAEYVRGGGGLGVLLGREAQPRQAFNEAAAQELLPGPLVRQWRSRDEEIFLAPDRYDHPILAPFRQLSTAAPWREFPVYRHWELAPLADDAEVVLRFSNRQPALIERSVGRGRVLVSTTPLSDPGFAPGREPWNLLPTGDEPWPFLVLANELTLHLAGAGQTRLNYSVGALAALPNPSDVYPERYQLFLPDAPPQDIAARDGVTPIPFTEAVGAYRLKGQREDTLVARGLSVNLPAAASDLTRAKPELLDAALGAGRYRLARSRDEIEREVGEGRRGREFYPYLLLLLTLVLALEQWLSNRFYPAPAEVGGGQPTRAKAAV